MTGDSAPLQTIYRLRGDAVIGQPATGYVLLNCGHRIERADWSPIETTPEGWRAMPANTVTRYRVEVWSERQYRWMPTAVQAPNLPELLADVEGHIGRDNGRTQLAQPSNRRIVECRETVIPWPEGASE